MRRKRLARVGKSLAVIVDRELLDALGFDASTAIELRARDGVLVVARANAEALRRSVEALVPNRSRGAS